MHKQAYSVSREAIVANAIQDFVAELRMVELADYVSFIHLGHLANLADIVDSAAELYFMPGTLRLGHGGNLDLAWSGEQKVVLDLELKPSGATVFFSLSLGDYIAVQIVGGKTQLLGNIIYGQLVTANNQPLAAALSLIPLFAIVAYLLAMRRTGALESL